jgi:trimethyllysine dioxygenase
MLVRCNVICEPTGPSSHPHSSFYPWSWLREHSYDPRQKPLSVQELVQKLIIEMTDWHACPVKFFGGLKYNKILLPSLMKKQWMNKMTKDYSNGYLRSWVPLFLQCIIAWLACRIDLVFALSKECLLLQKAHKGCLSVSVSSGRRNVIARLLWREAQAWLLLDGRFWDFTADLAKGDTAYTTLALGAHTDNTYFVCCLTTHWTVLNPNHRLIHVDSNYSTSSRTPMDPEVRLY